VTGKIYFESENLNSRAKGSKIPKFLHDLVILSTPY
jgi:hypothetical protein